MNLKKPILRHIVYGEYMTKGRKNILRIAFIAGTSVPCG
jgi:hypothetical protein